MVLIFKYFLSLHQPLFTGMGQLRSQTLHIAKLEELGLQGCNCTWQFSTAVDGNCTVVGHCVSLDAVLLHSRLVECNRYARYMMHNSAHRLSHPPPLHSLCLQFPWVCALKSSKNKHTIAKHILRRRRSLSQRSCRLSQDRCQLRFYLSWLCRKGQTNTGLGITSLITHTRVASKEWATKLETEKHAFRGVFLLVDNVGWTQGNGDTWAQNLYDFRSATSLQWQTSLARKALSAIKGVSTLAPGVTFWHAIITIIIPWVFFVILRWFFPQNLWERMTFWGHCTWNS